MANAVNARPVRMDLVQPEPIFLNQDRRHLIPKDQEATVVAWEIPDDPREVYVLRTVQQDLVCHVFDQVTGGSCRRYIGERGEYSQKEAEEFIRNRTPRLVNSRNGVSAIFLSVHERVLKIWQIASHEIFLVHNENDDKIDWTVSFINEDRVERLAMGIARKLQHLIPFWQRNDPQIQINADGTVSVLFPDVQVLAPPAPAQLLPALPPPPVTAAILDRETTSFQIGIEYIDNIGMRIAKRGDVSTILGYAKNEGCTPWSYAPLSDGTVPSIPGTAFNGLWDLWVWKNKPWAIKPLPATTGFFGAIIAGVRIGWAFGQGVPIPGETTQGAMYEGKRFYTSGEDCNKRLYFLVPANDGWVPVRHPTDPRCGNWLSKTTLTKIVYDTHRFRWPGCEGVDYRKHGFIPQDENNKTWWPIKNGTYQPTFFRLKDPYFPQYQQLDREVSSAWLVAQAVLGAAAFRFGYTATLAAADAAERVRDVMNLGAVGNGIHLGQQGVQILAPLALNEARENEQLQARAAREYVTQTEVLETLEKQDAYDRGEEVVRATAVAGVDLVRELLQGGAIPRESRYQAVILAASSGYPNTLRALMDRTEIDVRVLKAAEFAAKENNYHSVLQVLREYRRQERVIPR